MEEQFLYFRDQVAGSRQFHESGYGVSLNWRPLLLKSF